MGRRRGRVFDDAGAYGEEFECGGEGVGVLN